MSYFSQHTIDQATYQATEPNNNFMQTKADGLFSSSCKNGTLEGIECNIFPARTFCYADC